MGFWKHINSGVALDLYAYIYSTLNAAWLVSCGRNRFIIDTVYSWLAVNYNSTSVWFMIYWYINTFICSMATPQHSHYPSWTTKIQYPYISCRYVHVWCKSNYSILVFESNCVQILTPPFIFGCAYASIWAW